MLIPHGTVVALVDGKRFILLRNSGTEAEPELTAMPTPALAHNNHSNTGHRSSAGNHADHLVEEDAFATAATNWLNDQAVGHKIDKLIVIAAPRTLGEMRRHYRKQLEQVIVHELAKDLTAKKPPEVLAALRVKH